MPDVVVPALNFVDAAGRLDRDAIGRYADRAAATWVTAFLLSGSTTRGDLLTVAQRGEVIDLWLDVAPALRLIACCWQADDIAQADARGVASMMVMRDRPDQGSALRFLAGLPRHTHVYSHPMYSPTVLDADLAAAAAAAGVLPPGGKIAKISLDGIATLRAAAGGDFALWDGSSRHIADSMAAGASGVIATPLSAFPPSFPPREIAALQHAINATQHALDALPTRAQRSELLLRHAADPAASRS
jgi:dihydrodipicolinate synthase/N-acetylneuraminate lyase